MFPSKEEDGKDHPLSVFHLPLPEVNDNVDWNLLYVVSSDDLRYHVHLHTQPYYIDAETQRILFSPSASQPTRSPRWTASST